MNISARAREAELIGWSIRVRGTVQGVGFRPAVYELARQMGIKGHVLNNGEGVVIEAWATEQALELFLQAIRENAPPLAHIERIEKEPLSSCDSPAGFEIAPSENGEAKTAVVADAATCGACLQEIFDPSNRRFRYPFTNCTHCGPRFSIIKSIPFDRPNTSMAPFAMCNACQTEYDDPQDTRFHAQANACRDCGPKVVLLRADGGAVCWQSLRELDEIDVTASLIKQGQIVAIKGIGGIQFTCDAMNEEVVAKLRSRKQRFDKPFALLVRNLDVARKYCDVSAAEAALLQSHASPIVILRHLTNQRANIASSVAPRQATLGIMLPNTPLHHLLMKGTDTPIVLTSGNVSDEPQCTDNDDSVKRLGKIADYLLLHDREIVNREDDSVVRVINNKPSFLRRARGYAPAPLMLPDGFEGAPEILAMGGELKNTFRKNKNGRAILSQHIGDLEDARTNEDYKKNLALYENLFQLNPKRIAVDLHPEYLSGKLARLKASQNNLVLDEIQHHHAHIAACLADNDWPREAGAVLGVALDGLGYGCDGTFWGGEFFLAEYTQFKRLGTFKPVAMLGSAQAMREPWRNTYAHLMAAMGWDGYQAQFATLELTKFFESKALATFDSMLVSGAHSPLASSCGRLFDAVAAAMGVCREGATYEGQAAIELESCVDLKTLYEESDDLSYPFAIQRLPKSNLPYIEPLGMWHALLGDLLLEAPVGVMAARFHKGLAKAIEHMITEITRQDNQRCISTVALSGGVFQNKYLSELLTARLKECGFSVLTHSNVPANDGGLSLGQAVISAAWHLQARERK